jgi:OOP family OmpA-OmpF porin
MMSSRSIHPSRARATVCAPNPPCAQAPRTNGERETRLMHHAGAPPRLGVASTLLVLCLCVDIIPPAEAREVDDSRLDTALADPDNARRLAPVVAAREAAAQADAELYAESAWRRAEAQLSRLLNALERGRLEAPGEREDELLTLYRTARAQAAETVLLAEARNAMQNARRHRLPAATPTLMARAQAQLDAAAAQLAATPADSEAARRLASEAVATVHHAHALAAAMAALPAQGREEALLLQWEDAMLQILQSAGRDAPRARGAGPAALTRATLDATSALNRQVAALDLALQARNAMILELQTRLAATDDQLASTAYARAALARELESTRRSGQRRDRLTELFGPEEAEVSRQGDQILLRLTGIHFNVGGTEVDDASRALLTKVADAILLFPAANVVIEGHTDASGDMGVNQRVSEARAERVRGLLLELTAMADSRMLARGLGETRPIASNDTAAGRALNRRIDVRIDPRERPTG